MTEQEIIGATTAYKSILGNRKAYYLSTPITTGLEFYLNKKDHSTLEWEDKDEVDQAVKNNLFLAEQTVLELRNQTKTPIICPGSLHMKDWGQHEYMVFWRTTIKDYVWMIFFRDGWEYSIGCIEEFLYAKSIGVSTVSQHLYDDSTGAEITYEKGIEMIQKALEHLKSLGFTNLKYFQIIPDLIEKHKPVIPVLKSES